MIELRIRSRYGVNVIGIRRPVAVKDSEKLIEQGEELPKTFLLSLPPEDSFQPDDILVIAGTEEDVKKIAELK